MNKFNQNTNLPIISGGNNISVSQLGSTFKVSNTSPSDVKSSVSSSPDNSIVRFNGTDGKTIQNSNVLISDTDEITANKFIKSGGQSYEYLMADGSITISSGSGGNSSNIYLYNSNTTILAPTGASQIRYNNAVQDNATEIYISHLTRDNVDIDEFLNLITDLSIIYIQDQNSSLNFIKYIRLYQHQQ